MATVLLTGANGSLAIPAVNHLLSNYPSFTLVLTVRNTSDNDVNTAKLRECVAKFPNANYSIRKLDLASLAAVQAFAAEINAEIADRMLPRVAAIICNAMTWSLSSGVQYSEDGYESCMAINHLSQFALVLRLLGSCDAERGRIVFLGSDTHYPGKAGFEKLPPVFPKDLELLVHPAPDTPGEEVNRGFQRYGLSKAAVVTGMHALNRRLQQSKDLKGISALAVDPGGLLDSRAFAGSHVPRAWQIMLSFVYWLQPVLKYLKPSLRVSVDGAKDVVDFAVSDKFAGQGPYVEVGKRVESSPESRDEGIQDAIWDKSLEWCKITQKDTAVPF